MDYTDKTKEELIGDLKALEKELISLKTLISEDEIDQKQIKFELKERLKELSCHDILSEAMSNPANSINEVAQTIIQTIPPSWQFPEIAQASLEIYDQSFKTANFKPTDLSLKQAIKVNQETIGQLEVCYPIDGIPAGRLVFLPEESKLLFSIAVKLGNYIEKEEKKTALQDSEAKYKDLIVNLNEVIFTTDQQANITFISPSITKLMGYSPEEVIGKNFRSFVGASQEYLYSRFEAIQTKLELQNEYQIYTKTGEAHWIRFSSKAIIKDNKFVGTRGTLSDITESKLIELELQKSESLYRSILQASPDTIFIADLEGRVLFTSPMALKMFGYEHSDFPLNTSLFEFIDPKDHDKAKEAISQMFHGIYLGATEYVAVKSDGSTFDIEVNGEFIRNAEGKPTSMVFVVRDVSDRKIAEEKLRKSEEQFRKLVESINDIVFDVTLDGTIKYVSPSIKKLFNYEPESLVGQNFLSFVHPEDLPFLIDVFKNDRFSEHKNIEYRCLSQTGEIIWVQVSAQYSYEQGQVIGRSGIIHDVTEQKLTEEKLRKSEEQYRKLVESVNDVIYEIDETGTIKYVSPSIIQVLGYTVEEAMHRNIFSFIYKEDVANIKAILKNLPSQDYKFMEYRYIRKDGSVRWVRSSTSPIIKEGKMVGGTGTLTDITDRKIAETALLNSEEKFSKAFKTAPYAISITSAENGDFFEINDSFTVHTGYSKEEVLADSSIGLKLWANLEDRNSMVDDLKQGKEILAREYNFIRKNGETAICLFSASMIFLNNKPYLLSSITDISEIKQAELQLRKLSRAVEQSPVSIVITNLDGEIEYANPKATESTGYSMEELKGQNPRVLKSGETPISEYQQLWESISKGEIWKGIFHNKRKNGELYWETSQITPILDSNGHIINYLAIKEDITERKATQEALLRSEERFSQIAQQSKSVIWEVDSMGLYTYVSQLAEVVWGYPPEDLVGKKHFYDLHPEKGREEFKKIALEAFHRKVKFSDFQNQILRGDNRTIWVSTNGIPVTDEQNNLIGYRGADNDITERLTALEELSQSEERYKSIFRKNHSVMTIIDPESGQIKDVNNSACEYYGWSYEEMCGKNISEINALTINETRKELQNAKEDKRNHFFLKHRLSSGELRDVEVYSCPIRFGDSTLLYFIVHDITDRIKAEEALKSSENELNYAQTIARMGSWELNLATDKLTWSKNYFNLLEISSDDKSITNDHFLKLIHPDDKNLIEAKLQEIHKSKTQAQVDLRLLMPDGRIKWIQNNIVPEFDGDNLIILKGVNIDITEKKLAEEALKINETALNQAQEISMMCSWEFDLKTQKITWSNNYHRLMGVSQDVEIRNEFFLDKVHPDDLSLVQAKHDEMKLFKKPVTYDIRILMPDQQYRWFENNIVPEFEGLELVRFKGVNIDITEKKHAEESIRQKNERLSAIIGAMPDLIFIVDQHGTYLEYYSPGPDILVIPDDQFIGTNIKDIFGSELAELHLQKITECLQQKRLITYNFSGEEDHQIKSFEVRSAPLGVDRVLTFVRNITEEKRKDNELKKLYLGIEQSPVMTVITNLNADIEYVNTAFQEITGYSANEVMGKNVRILQSGKTEPVVYHELWQTIKTGKEWHGQWINKKKNGELFWEDVLITPIQDENQNITNYLAVKQDITQRKQTEEILRHSEEKYRFMFENNPQPMWIYDLETLQFLEVNQAAINHYGFSRDEFMAMTIADIRPSEDINALLEDVKETTEQLNPVREWRHRIKNGEIIFVEISSHSMTFNDRKARHVLVKDITQRKIIQAEINKLNANLEITIAERTSQLALTNISLQHEIEERNRIQEALSKSEQSYRTVVENVNEVIFQTDADGLWLFLNKSWESVTGFSVKESIGQLFVNYVHPDDRARNWELFEPLIQRKKDYCRHEIRYLTKEGDVRLIEVFARLGVNENNEITGTYGTLMDITERKLAEESLMKASARLTLALRAGGIGVWDYDIDNDILIWDNQMLAIYGITEEDFIGAYEVWQKGLHPDDKVRGNEEIQLAIRGEKEFDTEFRVVWPDGSIHSVRALAAVQRDASGHALHMIGTNWDITVQKQSADFENELLQLSPKLTGISLPEIETALHLALSRIGQFLSADRAYIFEFNEAEASMSNTFEWCNHGITPEIDNLQNIPFNLLPKWMETIHNKENIIIPSINDLPESWLAEREILEPQGIQSLIVIPLIVENSIIGFVGLDSVITRKEYNPSEINILKVWSSILASLINNQRVETLLEQTHQNFETFFNTIDDFLFVFDESAKIIDVNKTVNERLGYRKEELVNNSILTVRPAERREEALCMMNEMLEGKINYCSVPLITRSGELIPVETRIKRGFWNGTPVIFGVSKDISQILLSEQKFASAFQSNSALMSISNFDNGQFLEVNGAFIETLGYARDEIIGKSSTDLQLFVDPNIKYQILNQLNQGIDVQKQEVLIQTKNNHIKTGLLSAESIFVGETRCLLIVVIDITERKRAEDELRTARMEAEQANVAKSEFLSRMSHELRTPMNSILGFAQLLEMGELDVRQKKGVYHIMHSGKHLLDLINEVLDISRIEAGRIALSLEPISVNCIIQEMMDIIRPQSEKRNVNLEFVSISTNLIYVKSDTQRLKQVLLNLLNNAIKYNKNGGSVTIKSEVINENSHDQLKVKIAISDTGPGISSEDIPKIFNPFERIGAEKSDIEGTGLGLAVVKKLVIAMNGTLGVESTPGQGSTFWIELPYCLSPKETIGNLAIKAESEIDYSNIIGKILYIEDNASNIELVSQILSIQRPGIQLITNMFGKQAVNLAHTHQPDLILLDLNLPDIHGSEVLNLLLANENTRTIPVVIITAEAMAGQSEKLLNAGAKEYLHKPLVIVDFLNVIDQFIGK